MRELYGEAQTSPARRPPACERSHLKSSQLNWGAGRSRASSGKQPPEKEKVTLADGTPFGRGADPMAEPAYNELTPGGSS